MRASLLIIFGTRPDASNERSSEANTNGPPDPLGCDTYSGLIPNGSRAKTRVGRPPGELSRQSRMATAHIPPKRSANARPYSRYNDRITSVSVEDRKG